jgi:histidyl-tRNA synthetase
MYTFLDKGGNSITLKPEMTPPVIRAYLENSLGHESQVQKLYYLDSMFRYEKPQEGRYREHTQFGAEIIGSSSIYTDVELIHLAKIIYNRCGINNFQVKINSIGKTEERKEYIKKLKDYFSGKFDLLSEDSKRRFDTNPLRILDSKDNKDRKVTETAPKIIDSLSIESKTRFENVLTELDNTGVDYEVDFRLVRGIDYYTDTTFEFISGSLGAQDAIGGGGRYDGLVELLGGKPTPGAGFASGIERIIMVAEKNGFGFGKTDYVKLYLVALDENAREISAKLMTEFRTAGISCDTDYAGRSFKAQMRDADKMNAEYVYIIGPEEVKKGAGILKNMSSSTQIEINMDELINHLVRNFNED